MSLSEKAYIVLFGHGRSSVTIGRVGEGPPPRGTWGLGGKAGIDQKGKNIFGSQKNIDHTFIDYSRPIVQAMQMPQHSRL